MRRALAMAMLALLAACGGGGSDEEETKSGIQPVNCSASGVCK